MTALSTNLRAILELLTGVREELPKDTTNSLYGDLSEAIGMVTILAVESEVDEDGEDKVTAAAKEEQRRGAVWLEQERMKKEAIKKLGPQVALTEPKV